MLNFNKRLDVDVVHLYDTVSGNMISSNGCRFEAILGGRVHRFSLPQSFAKSLLSPSRLCRRVLRLDKSNAVLNAKGDGIVLLHQGGIYFYNLANKSIKRTGTLRQCRNVLHCGVAVTKRGIYFGEYGHNTARNPVPIHCSRDDGRSWKVVYEFPAGSIRHIHGVYSDPYSDRLWIPTGDFAGECYLVSTNEDFTDVVSYGDGSQAWRSVTLLFQPDRIVWAMDSQLETSYLQIFDRRTTELICHRPFPGPVWYGKQLADGWTLLQTTVEVGAGVKSDFVHVFASRDLIEWQEVGSFRKDWWPMRYFKSGVLSFADGHQTSDDFILFGEALMGLDGCAYLTTLDL